MYQPCCTGSMIMKWFRDIFCETEKAIALKRMLECEEALGATNRRPGDDIITR